MAGVDHVAETICLGEGHLFVSRGIGRDVEKEREKEED